LAAVGDHIVCVFEDVLVIDGKRWVGPRLAEKIKQMRFAVFRVPVVWQVFSLAGRQPERMDDFGDRTVVAYAAHQQIIRCQRYKKTKISNFSQLWRIGSGIG
jgi:hypothetical protein